MTRSAILVLLLAGCGARNGLEVWPAEEVDAGWDAPVIDAPVPSVCPPPSDFGFTLVPGDTITLDAPYGEVSVGGDGATVVLAMELRARADFAIVTSSLDGRGMETAGSDGTYPGLFRPRVSVTDGVVRMYALESGPRLHLATPGASGSVSTEILHGPLVALDRPIWNGSELVVAGWNGFELFLGAFAPGGAAPSWRSFGPATEVNAAADPTTRISSLFYREGASGLRVETFAEAGAALWPPGGTVLEEIGFLAPLAFGLLDDGTGQPWVVAGYTRDDPGTLRATLRRFRADGSAAGGFSTPIAGGVGGVDLSTVAPAGHRSGYGMVAGVMGGGAIFHGAGEDFVGDARPVPMPCDGSFVSIASGPCGYVLACVGSGGGAVHTALAIPPLPR